jgi:hypothetical protein
MTRKKPKKKEIVLGRGNCTKDVNDEINLICGPDFDLQDWKRRTLVGKTYEVILREI